MRKSARMPPVAARPCHPGSTSRCLVILFSYAYFTKRGKRNLSAAMQQSRQAQGLAGAETLFSDSVRKTAGRLDEQDDFVETLTTKCVGEDVRTIAAHTPGVRLHHIEIGADVGGEVG